VVLCWDSSVGIAKSLRAGRSGYQPIPVAVRSKARVYGRSLAVVAGSNPSGGMGVCVVL
jgi:hypothetical protein